MTFRRISTPLDDEVRPILDFPEDVRNLATHLVGYFSGAVSKRGVAVDHTSNHFSEGDSTSLSFARDVAEPVHQRHVGVVEQVRSELHCFVNRRFFPIDQSVRVVVLGRMVLEVRLTEAAGVLGLDDSLWFGVQLDVVAHAPAERAGCVLDYVKVAHRLPCLTLLGFLTAGPTGRQDERSTKLPAAEAALDTARLVTTRFDFRPRKNVFLRQNPEADGLLVIRIVDNVRLVHAGVSD
jgi:hypothetical protein